MRTNGIDWTRCTGICTDGAKSLTEKHTGHIAHISKFCPSVLSLQCSQGVAAVKLVNFIKACPLNSRLFTLICNEMGSEHKALLLHIEVR